MRAKRVVVIEDNALFRQLLKARLESSGYETIAVEDGLEGLDIVRKERPDLVISDLMLPRMDGHKICRFLKFDRSCGNIPFVLLTSRETDDEADIAKHCGADAYLTKSMKMDSLMRIFQNLLNLYI